MNIDIGHENSTCIQLHGQDLGSGNPVLLVHGWPVGSTIWDKLVPPLLAAGRRVITFDRRGFRRSGRPSTGHDLDTLADDLARVIGKLALKDCVLAGHGMGCGEVLRLLGTYGSERVRSLVLVSPMPPVPTDAQSLWQALEQDRPAALEAFLARALGHEGQTLSAAGDRALWIDALDAAPLAQVACVQAWAAADLRDDLARIAVPCTVVHGSDDRIAPPACAARPLCEGIAGGVLLTVPDGPHALPWTHAPQVLEVLLSASGS